MRQLAAGANWSYPLPVARRLMNLEPPLMSTSALLLGRRGSGRQETGAIANLCSYWLLGIPTAYWLAFRWGFS